MHNSKIDYGFGLGCSHVLLKGKDEEHRKEIVQNA
jgi:hypothetical protein